MEPTVKVGIAGLGRSGWGIHARVFEKNAASYKVVSVLDSMSERRKEAVDLFGCKAYSDFDSFVADDEAELVVIATPSHLHAQHTIKALRSGKHVVCEKPMATRLAEVDEMIECARKTGRILTVFQNRRYAPDFLKVREVIQSGKLGRIVLVRISSHSFGRRWDWQTLRALGGGELRNNGSHAIDQALHLIGNEEPKVWCDLQRTLTLGDAEDHVKVVLKAPGSPVADVEITHTCAYPQNYWLIMGTQGGLTGSNDILRWKYVALGALPSRRVEASPTPDRSYNVEDISWSEETWELDPNSPSGECAFYNELYGTLRRGAPLGVTPESARNVMSVIEKCYKSCEEDDNAT